MKKRFIFGWFYISSQFVSAIYLLIYSALTAIGGLITLFSNPVTGLGILLSSIITAAIGILFLFCATWLIGRLRKGYTLNKVILIALLAISTLVFIAGLIFSIQFNGTLANSAALAGKEHLATGRITAVLLYVGWAVYLICALIYFKKRKDFFQKKKKGFVDCLSITK